MGGVTLSMALVGHAVGGADTAAAVGEGHGAGGTSAVAVGDDKSGERYAGACGDGGCAGEDLDGSGGLVDGDLESVAAAVLEITVGGSEGGEKAVTAPAGYN